MVDGVRKGLESKSFAMLWLAAYVFMLRVPSEALPMMRGGPLGGRGRPPPWVSAWALQVSEFVATPSSRSRATAV